MGRLTLTWPQRRLLLLLGMPAFGLAFTVTAVSTYVPVLVEQISGPVVVGALLAAAAADSAALLVSIPFLRRLRHDTRLHSAAGGGVAVRAREQKLPRLDSNQQPSG